MKKKEKVPIIIDTDPGVDDAIAIMLAASSNVLDVVGLTAVDGNVGYDLTFQNARNIASFLGMDCPVARGAQTQLEHPRKGSISVHGKYGLGNLKLPASEDKFNDSLAWDFIYEKAIEYNGELEIISIAPMTNLAHLFQKHPDVVPYIKRIISMGGTMWLGNRSKFSEFNYWIDPAAASIVFQSGVPITMIGLNVTMASGIPLKLIKRLTAGNSKYADALKKLLESYEDCFPNKNCEDSVTVHDAVAVAYAMDPGCCKTHKGYVSICTDDAQYGRSLVQFDDSKKHNTEIVTDINMDQYEEMLVDMMKYFKTL